jgi:hypothetical protein
MTEVPFYKHDIFCAPGRPFGDFGPDVSAEEGLLRAQKVARMLIQHDDHKGMIGLGHAFSDQDAPGLIYSDLPDQAVLAEYPVRWVADAGRDELQLFADWMRWRHTELQESLTRERYNLLAITAGGLLELEGEGFLAPDMVEKAYALTETVPLMAMSSFESGSWLANAVCRGVPGKVHAIGMTNLFKDRLRYLGREDTMGLSMLHEALHAYGLWSNAGFTQGLTKPGQPTGLVEEVIVAHQEAVVSDGNPTILNPDQRSESGPTVYRVARRFIAMLGQYGPMALPTQLLSDAWVTPLDEVSTRRGHPRVALENRLKRNAQKLLPEMGGFYQILQAINAVHPLDRADYIHGINLFLMARATATELDTQKTDGVVEGAYN